MKRIVLTAVITFFVTLLFNILLGLVRDSFRLGFILLQGVMSAVIMVVVVLAVQMIIKKFLPELMQALPVDEEAELGILAGFDTPLEDLPGARVNVVLDDFIETAPTATESSVGANEATAGPTKLSGSSFSDTDPELLAKAVRTALTRDES
jgi:hypothetical protein